MTAGEPDHVLLARWSAHSDEQAFAQLMKRYAPLVFGAAQRVLANAALAEEATQETFYRLLREGRRVRQSLAGWLHTTATRVAIDLQRSERARRRREQAPRQPVEHWADLAPRLDEALAALPEPQRDLLVRHYLQATPQRELARQVGLSLTTLHRQIQQALASLKVELEKRGCVLAACPLASLLPQAHLASVPATLSASLGKIHLAAGLAGTAGGAAGGAAAGASAWPIILWSLAALAVTLLVALVGWLSFSLTPAPPSDSVSFDRALPGPLVESPAAPAASDAPVASPWPARWPDLPQGRYLRISGIATPGPSDQIVVFEHPAGGGASLAVVFADGHLRRLKPDQLFDQLQRQADGNLIALAARLHPADRLEAP